ncbi:hypothetical protein K7X08_025492 [Anisodus acutangulus]|uniref:Monocopper oxidase-like protein SKU5 n=1 Tax=Anisodus acutangulus TaxID=402998 RepID=A0A9Q1R7Q9_9SOLA|nr:hypothetical protein K7X08_025492 [Anisodus acutangulus]
MRGLPIWIVLSLVLFSFFSTQCTIGEEIFLEWHVDEDNNIKPISVDQPVITINGKFPGPLLNATTNDNIHVNVFNDMDKYPILITWNGIQLRHNSWQDGVSGTNCAIQPNTNWTYEFQLKDQIGSFFYFPSINYEKAGGGFGPIRVSNRVVVQTPFADPEGDFDLLIGDWYKDSFKVIGDKLAHEGYNKTPNMMLMNGKGSYLDPKAKSNASFKVNQGKTYRLRISNVGSEWSFNFRIENHSMLLVETEGSYTNQIALNSLDVHVGQSYSVLVTADQDAADYYIVATAKMANTTQLRTLEVVGVLHYENSTKPADGPLPNGPDPFDVNFSINQARSIRWNLTTGAARPNPQGSFNVSNVTLSQTFVLQNSVNYENGMMKYAINNVSYATPQTPLKLADYYLNGAGVYELDKFPANGSLREAVYGTFVVSGEHGEWLEIVFKNELHVMDSWHLDGFGFFVVYPKGWTAVYVYLDNPGMWNLRSQKLKSWFLGQELYIRVYDSDPNPAKEHFPPKNLLYCGSVQAPPSAPPPSPEPEPVPGPLAPVPPAPAVPASTITTKTQWFHVIVAIFVILII